MPAGQEPGREESAGLSSNEFSPWNALAQPGLDTEDPEALAHYLNEQRRRGYSEAQPPEDGYPPDDPVLAGPFEEVPPPPRPPVSEGKEAVTLPVVVRVMYDYARSQGWKQGDGSLSAFVTDILLDHFQSCWGLAVAVVEMSGDKPTEVEHDHTRNGATARTK